MSLEHSRSLTGHPRSIILLLSVVAAFAGWTPHAARAAAIPTDGHGLPLWQVAVFEDFPVRIELSGRTELEDLLSTVPVADFNREQIRPLPGGAVTLETRVTAAEAAALAAAGYRFERLRDLEQEGRRAVEAVWAQQAAAGFTDLQPGKALFYPTHAQIGTDFAALAAANPSLARTFSMGLSVQGRDLWGIVISDDVGSTEPEPEVRLTGTIHGDEPVAMVMLYNLAFYLVDNYGQPGYEDVTDLVDHYEIHIMPLHNPDGYAAGTRSNANGVDLNRNYPDPAGTHAVQEQETLNFMTHANNHHFVISQNGHGGALVVNYPWDYTYTRAPDDAALIELSLEYSTFNLPMYNGSFPQGITNGADWYIATGTLQDWSYDTTGCIDVTVELGNTKWPAASTLQTSWDDNRESLMHYVKAARYGVNGVVTGSDTGLPLDAAITVTGNAMPVHTDPEHGDYYKLLDSGIYTLTFSSPGYLDEVVTGVATTWGTPTVLDVVMDPVAHGDVSGVVTGAAGAGLDAQVNVYALPLDQFHTAVQAQASSGGAYTAHLPYGDYRLEAVASGYQTVSQTVTVGAVPATLDFVLGAIETVDLFASDFESGMEGWTGGWGLAATGNASTGSLTDSPSGNYADSSTNIVTMVEGVDLTGALGAQVSFWAKWQIEDMWDGCFFEMSADGGSAWTPLATAFTGAATGQGGQTPAGAPCFDNNQTTWVLNTVTLNGYLDRTDVRFRFRLDSDSSINRDGYSFDDFTVTVTRIQQGISPVPAAPGDRLAVSAWPNPFNPQTTVSFTLPGPGLAAVQVFDLRGRLVRTLESGFMTAGPDRRVWDGTNEAGSPVGSGVYFVRLKSDHDQVVTKVLMLK
ncbi:MAG: M14 family zinc carboxypeptidase [Candidatus Krumholzibacteriia bacterium]